MSKVSYIDIRLSRKEFILISDLLKNYCSLFEDSDFLDINFSPGIALISSLRVKLDSYKNLWK